MRVWRIGDPHGRFAIFSGEGAALQEGRWHRRGQDVIYTGEHYSTAMLEKLVHWNGMLPPNQHFIEIMIAAGVSYEVVTKDMLPGWDARSGRKSRSYGSKWFEEGRSCLLIAPSVVAREENNILINPRHGDFAMMRAGLEKPVRWDSRLFS